MAISYFAQILYILKSKTLLCILFPKKRIVVKWRNNKVGEGIYIRSFTKFGIKVLWRLYFLRYLRTLSLKFQKARTKLDFWNFKFKILKWPINCRPYNTLIPWSLKNPVSPNLCIPKSFFDWNRSFTVQKINLDLTLKCNGMVDTYFRVGKTGSLGPWV